jgi:serine/threonine protein kinase
MPLVAGTRLGPYEVLDLVGFGGMGEVYRARDPRLGRDVAIKVLPAEVGADPDRLRRFEQEARAVAALNHPNILTVFDVGAHVAAGETAVGAPAPATPYVVMELLQGETLREMASRRAPTQRQVLGWAAQTAQGLEAAHAKGIVHRDLKPENVFVTTEGRVKVLDFGLAKQVDRLTAESGEATASSPTDAGQVVGTVGYMSPEQVRGLAVDPRTDVFSFGVLLYELLGGRHPFRRETTIATLTAILEEAPAELSTLGRGIPPAVSGIVRRCLEKGRQERYGSAHDVRVALEAVLAAPAGSAVLQEVEERSPYPGLASFTEKDSVSFFGREHEAKALWERLRARPLWGVIGPSGAGKTSFVRAGVVASRPEGWAAIVCAPGAAPFRGLGQALVPELAGDVEAMQRLLSVDDPAVAFDLVSRWRKGHAEALLVVDQLEELFTLNAREVQERFAGLLGRLAREADVHVLLAFRDDFLMKCADHEPLARVFESLTPLPALSAEGLGRALVEPAKARGYRFEDDALVEEMVESVEGARSALPLLAFAVSRLWEKRDREKKVLTRAGYEEIGGVAGALAQHAEATLDRIGSARTPIAREIFRTLVTSQGTRSVAERGRCCLSSRSERRRRRCWGS